MRLRGFVPTLMFAAGLVAADTVKSIPAQTPAASEPLTFEVASIKLSGSLQDRGSVRVAAGGRFIATNVPLRSIIGFAYGLKSYQLVGGPTWIGADRFVIEARAGGDIPAERMRSMTRALLAERFKLVAHLETRSRPGYALVVSRTGGLVRSTATEGLGFREGPGTLSGKGVSMTTLADILSTIVGNAVVDRTNVAGGFDIELKWSPEFERTPGAPVSDAPSIFTAVQEQLGLKLESQSVPLEVLLIDSVSRPTEN